VLFFDKCFSTLGKKTFAEYYLSSVTFGKSFAEYKLARHSAKNTSSVVVITLGLVVNLINASREVKIEMETKNILSCLFILQNMYFLL
jgi:hypothetical protein